ncbi:MAG TPA: rhomboid family intramembrane serine protease, partial [Chthoniobacterales bacterium]|nr:rhomboid family intramembrane serine protease [Chthoniobacterales bacterium]
MIDLNHILLFIACISPLVMLGQSLRGGGSFRAWRLASLAVLIVTGGAWLIDANTAGFVGGGAWFALLLVPAVGIRKVSELASHQRYGWARCLARPLRFLHPAGAMRVQAELLRGLELAQAGNYSEALAVLAPLRNNHTNVGRQATAQSFRLRGEWVNLVGWVRSEVPPVVRRTDFALLPLYLRALGEAGARDEMLLEFASVLTAAGPVSQPAWSYQSSLVPVLAFSGRLPTHADSGPVRKFPRELREFWIGTNELAAGEASEGRARLLKLQGVAKDQLLLSEASQRLAGVEVVTHAPLSPPAFALLHRIEQSERPAPTAFGSETMRPTVVVLIFIALNIAMFVAELRFGGSTNPFTLHRLGALEPWAVRYGGEYWRMLTSLFLHFGLLHLLFNLYALFVIGPGLERIIGSVRFALYYLLAGLGSSAGVLLLRFANFSRPEQLVGASGCVMGV